MLYRDPNENDPKFACGSNGPASLDGQHHVPHTDGGTFPDVASVHGYNGTLDFDRSISSDGKRVTIQATSPVIANRDYQCFSYTLSGRQRSRIENPDSRYDSACDCWYLNFIADPVGEDWTGTGTQAEYVFFDGFGPQGGPSGGLRRPPSRTSVSRPRTSRRSESRS